MHKSRLAGFIIDCQTDDVDAASLFWAAALGLGTRHDPTLEGPNYVRLLDPDGLINLEVQKVTHASRVHLDIETDDIEAEVRRLETLGAKVVENKPSWCVMQAPTGQRLCVVTPQNARFEEMANVWEPD